MRKIISSFVAAIADFIEFDEAVMTSAQSGKLSESQLRMARAQSDAFWQRAMRAPVCEPHLSFKAELAEANEVIAQRRLERKLAHKRRQQEIAEARAMKEMLQGA